MPAEKATCSGPARSLPGPSAVLKISLVSSAMSARGQLQIPHGQTSTLCWNSSSTSGIVGSLLLVLASLDRIHGVTRKDRGAVCRSNGSGEGTRCTGTDV